MSKKRIVFKNMEHSDVMEQHANKQLERVEKFLEHERTPIFIELFLEPSHVHSHHKIELVIKTPNYDRAIGFEGADFYKVLDHVIDTMNVKLHEDKQRLKIDDAKTTGRHEDFKKQR